MLTPKQRSNLRGQASTLKPVMQLGKGGFSDNVIRQLEDHLFSHELVKIKVLKNAEYTAKEAMIYLGEATGAETVSCMGNIVTLYKFSEKEGITHITF